MDESAKLSSKTRSRTLEPINKLGYMDGAVDGQNASFQTSFNVGYEQGFAFGQEIGFNEAFLELTNKSRMPELQDQRRINCEMCVMGTEAKENIANLFNKQKQKNDNLLGKLKQ